MTDVFITTAVRPPHSKTKFRGLLRQRTIPTERPQLVGEVYANFSG
jgi:hypothetical protein